MTAAAETRSASASGLHAALLDYFSAPGKYQLSLRQPAALFAAIREILQIAAGRGVLDDLPAGQTEKLREAAAFFIRAALLYPGADHYAVLGLPARTEPVELKERYRLMMRLIHPDFMPAGSAAWPADAAVRVNRANEILSSPVLRKEYDEQLASLHSHRAAEAAMVNAHRSAARIRQDERSWHVNPKAAWALGAGAVGAALLLLMPSPESTDLVQKSPAPLNAPPRAAAAAGKEADAALGTALIASEAMVAPKPADPVIAAVPAPPPVSHPVAPSRQENRVEPPPPARAPAAAPVFQPRRETPPQALFSNAPARPIEDAPAVAAAPPVVAPAPVPVPVAVPAPPPPSVPAPVAAARPPAPIAAAVPSPTLADAQPMLSQLLQMLETGRGEQLLRLLEADVRRSPPAQALSQQYDQLVRGARPVRLTQVEFKGEARDGVLLVTGRIRLHAGEPTIGSHGERFLVRAEFVSRGGKVLLTGLSGASD